MKLDEMRCSDLDVINTIDLINAVADYLDETLKTKSYIGEILRDRSKRIKEGLDYYSKSDKEVDKPYKRVLETMNMSINQFKGELIKIEEELKKVDVK